MTSPLCLNDIKPGEKARVCCLTSSGSISPLGDPAAYQIRGAVIAIRKADSRNIQICRKEKA